MWVPGETIYPCNCMILEAIIKSLIKSYQSLKRKSQSPTLKEKGNVVYDPMCVAVSKRWSWKQVMGPRSKKQARGTVGRSTLILVTVRLTWETSEFVKSHAALCVCLTGCHYVGLTFRYLQRRRGRLPARAQNSIWCMRSRACAGGLSHQAKSDTLDRRHFYKPILMQWSGFLIKR